MAEPFAARDVHFRVDLRPRQVVKGDDQKKKQGGGPGKQKQDPADRKSNDQARPQIKRDVFAAAIGPRSLVENLEAGVVKEHVVLVDFFKVADLSVHGTAVKNVLDKAPKGQQAGNFR
jgi:hypothetical protein